MKIAKRRKLLEYVETQRINFDNLRLHERPINPCENCDVISLNDGCKNCLFNGHIVIRFKEYIKRTGSEVDTE